MVARGATANPPRRHVGVKVVPGERYRFSPHPKTRDISSNPSHEAVHVGGMSSALTLQTTCIEGPRTSISGERGRIRGARLFGATIILTSI